MVNLIILYTIKIINKIEYFIYYIKNIWYMDNNTELVNENIFNKNLEELLVIFTSQKVRITEFIQKNFREDIHYIKIKNNTKQHGGQNKINYFLTEKTFELVKNTFNLKHRYITKIGNSQHINILMSLENQTIGFIENSFKNVVKTKRQYNFSTYYVDLYFPKYKLVVECDECDHKYRNETYEAIREKYILLQGNTIIRFNPNDSSFDLSLVLREINRMLFSKEKINKVIKITY